MAKKITCIEKAAGDHENPDVAITNMSWVEDGTQTKGSSTRQEMYDQVKANTSAGYVQDTLGNKAYLICEVSAKGTKYVKTKPDDVKSDNLLKLSEC